MKYDLKTGEEHPQFRFKPVRFMKIVVVTSFLIPLLYLIFCCVLTWKTGNSMDSSVTTGVFAFWGTEIFVTAWIKNTETKHKGEDNDDTT